MRIFLKEAVLSRWWDPANGGGGFSLPLTPPDLKSPQTETIQFVLSFTPLSPHKSAIHINFPPGLSVPDKSELRRKNWQMFHQNCSFWPETTNNMPKELPLTNFFSKDALEKADYCANLKWQDWPDWPVCDQTDRGHQTDRVTRLTRQIIHWIEYEMGGGRTVTQRNCQSPLSMS